MAEVWKGAPVSARLNDRIGENLARLAEHGVVPKLAIVRIGDRADDLSYERSACRRAASAGISAETVALPADAVEKELLAVLSVLNGRRDIHGILLLRPLPAHMDEARVCNAIAPDKDVDGVTQASLASVFAGRGRGFAPCTAQACIELLDYYGRDLTGLHAVVVGRSLVVGRPLSMLLLQRNATVTVCHTRTRDLPAFCRKADMVIAAAGKPELLDASYFSAGQTVIDVGIHVREDGSLCGDVAFEKVRPLAAHITPVPGGIGAVTTAVLLLHVTEAALWCCGERVQY